MEQPNILSYEQWLVDRANSYFELRVMGANAESIEKEMKPTNKQLKAIVNGMAYLNSKYPEGSVISK